MVEEESQAIFGCHVRTPAGQSWQIVAPDVRGFTTPPLRSVASFEACLPTGQAVQLDAPRPENCPAPHGLQSEALSANSCALNFPAVL